MALAMGLLALGIIAVLYFGRDVFVPLALAILLSFVLAPGVRFLQRLRCPRGLAVACVVLLAFAAIFALGTLMVSQVTQLATDLPRYQSTMQEKIKSMQGALSASGPLRRAADVLQELGKELKRAPASAPETMPPSDRSVANAPGKDAPARPVLVEMREQDGGPFQIVTNLISPLLHPLATTGIIVIFVVFILAQRDDLRNRLIRLAGTRDLHKTTAAIDDAAHRLSRLFLAQILLNSAFGLTIGIGLWLIGIPTPALWGALAGILRFVPFIGAFIAATFPLFLAVAVDPGWSMLLWTAALFIIIEPLVGHVIEPLVAGHSTGLSPVAVLVAATFWTVLWGPIGLVLATPLTMCLVVLGRHTNRLQFIDVMFGDEPALSAPQIFYQRVLAGDPVEATAQAREILKTESVMGYYEEVALAGLRLAHADAVRGSLDLERQQKILDSIQSIVESIPQKPQSRTDSPDDTDPGPLKDVSIFCVGGRAPLDQAAALLLCNLLGTHGFNVSTLGAQASSKIAVPAGQTVLVCLSLFDAPSAMHVRYAVRALRHRAPGAAVMVGLWRARDPRLVSEIRQQAIPDYVVTSLDEALAAAFDAAWSDTADVEKTPALVAHA